jgi:hypothetical protein
MSSNVPEQLVGDRTLRSSSARGRRHPAHVGIGEQEPLKRAASRRQLDGAALGPIRTPVRAETPFSPARAETEPEKITPAQALEIA